MRHPSDITLLGTDALAQRNRTAELQGLADILPKAGTASFTRQQDPLGLGHAVWCARELIGDEPFALLLPDMITQSSEGKRCLGQMLDVYNQSGGNIIAVEEVAPEEAHKFGIVATGPGKDPVWPITGMVEKPAKGTAPSNLYIMGRYILQPEIFPLLSRMEKGAGGNPDHRRHGAAAGRAAIQRRSPSWPHLRLRLQDRLPHRQHRFRPRPR